MPLLISNVARATIVCTYVFSFLAIISIAIHIFVRVKLVRVFSLEDVSTCLAAIITMGLVGQITWAVIDEGQGEHMSNMTRSQFDLTAKSLLVNEALWALVNAFIRLSASLSLHRLFGVSDRRRLQAVTLICITIMHGVAALLVAVTICRPIQASWDSHIQGTCGNQTVAYVGLEVCGLLIDIGILALPVYPVLNLNMPMVRRLGLLLVLSTGAVVIIITALRIAALHRVNSPDFSYDQGYLGLLSTVGALLSIITCCVVSFNHFVRHIRSMFPAPSSQRLLVRLLRPCFESRLRERIDWMYYLAGTRRSCVPRGSRGHPVEDNYAGKTFFLSDEEDE
ncbi:hypothetical protein F4781DRAFT_6301 [Annulohypoxylon bovei var. microspora]|nr:hypothetical protein F4781DRAFT_6301 [Annulohypoxylon bovei var. microspora]